MEVAQFLGSQGPWQCQLHKGACSYCHRRYDTIRACFSPWQLCPSENWVWMWHSCLDRGDPSVMGHQLPQSQEIWPFKCLSSLWKLVIRRPLWLVLLCCLACQELKRPVSLGSFSIVQLSVLVCGERESNGDGCTPYVWLNSITLPPWLPGFLPQAFPMVISLMSPLAVSLPSKAWDCTPIPMLQLPAIVLSRGLASLSGVRMATVRIVCVILIPFRLSQISCFTLSLKCFSSVPNNCLYVEIRALLQFPHPPRQGPILLTLLFFPLLPHPTEFCLVLCILFQGSGTPACSQLVFFKIFCVWRWICDVSMERDVLHIYLLLCHLENQHLNNTEYSNTSIGIPSHLLLVSSAFVRFILTLSSDLFVNISCFWSPLYFSLKSFYYFDIHWPFLRQCLFWYLLSPSN